MRLQRLHTTLPAVRLRLTVPGELKAALDTYGTYYHDVYGDAVTVDELILHILTTFVRTDREFRAWQHHGQQVSLPPLALPAERSLLVPRQEQLAAGGPEPPPARNGKAAREGTP